MTKQVAKTSRHVFLEEGNLVIRQFEDTDLKDLTLILQGILSEELASSMKPEECTEEYVKDLVQLFRKGGKVLLAEVDKRIVGYRFVLVGSKYNRHVAFAQGLGVHPKYRGRGIATKLMQVALDILREEGIEKFVGTPAVSNAAVRKILEKTGFIIEGRLKKHLKLDDKYEDLLIASIFLKEK